MSAVMLEDLQGTAQAVLENVLDQRVSSRRLDQIDNRLGRL